LSLKADDFDYHLPGELIANQPCKPRDHSRLMCLCRSDRKITHTIFHELPRLLQPGDLLVVNDTRVIPARFDCRRQTGALIEGLFLREIEPRRWEVMLKNAGRCRPEEELELVGSDGAGVRLLEKLSGGRWTVEVSAGSDDTMAVLGKVGRTPLPPYIARNGASREDSDRQDYQTIYAARPGAVAAPTAGLHFTERVFADLADRGVAVTTVTLHVGLGTFEPVRRQRLADHRMHSEWYELPSSAADEVNAARRQSRRVIAVGTTSVRVLESAAPADGTDLTAGSGWTDLFIYPPAEFRVIDALITNFHLPKSTLLMLVAAFCSPAREEGLEIILDAYRQAVRRGYRFYSYGDAMLIE